MTPDSPKTAYTCADYREEMRLIGLRRRLTRDDLSESEKASLSEEIRRIESEMGLD